MAKIYPKAYFKDKIVDFTEANLSIASSPVLYGLSTYSVIPLYVNSKTNELNIFRLHDHFIRLSESAKILSFNDFLNSWSEEKFEDTVIKLIKANNIKSDSLIRINLFVDGLLGGTKMTGLPHKLAIFIYESKPVLPLSGAKLMVSSWRRTSDNAIPARAKVSGSYVNSSLMKNEALTYGFDDAIALDEAGHVSESTVSNILIVRNGYIITPAVHNDVLEGITIKTVMTIAKELDIPHEFDTIDRSELYIANEVFLSGSSVSITPVISIDNRKIGDGKPGDITNKISDYYYKISHGSLPDKHHWLTKV